MPYDDSVFSDDQPPADRAEYYRSRIRDALHGYSETTAQRVQRERWDAKERRRAEGRPTPVDYLRRALDLYEARGYVTERTERYDPVLKRRFDLFGCVDALAIGEGRILAIQATSWDNVGARRTKMLASKKLQAFLGAGGQAVVVGFRKGSNGRYEHKEVFLEANVR